MSELKGVFCLVLHAHLPYVINHGKWPHGTDWLNEAAAETYIPILGTIGKLIQEGYSPKTTIGITPVLCEQLRDESFKQDFKQYLQMKIDAALADENEFKLVGEINMANNARMWQAFYSKISEDFLHRYNQDIIGEYKKLQDEGHIEIITCGATHGYFPLLGKDTSIQAQIKEGIRVYKSHFGRPPLGIWLPECGFRPRYHWTPPINGEKQSRPYLRKGVDELLSENNLQYFIIDSHLLKGGKAIGVYLERFEALQRLWGQFSRYYEPRPEEKEKTPRRLYWTTSTRKPIRPMAVFTRDPKTSLQVWSGKYGYPGDVWYLEFHKKKFPGGHRYWRITGPDSDLADKMEYEYERISGRIHENALHFVNLLNDSLTEHISKNEKGGVITAPFDAELFGHWWFEGPLWYYETIRRIYAQDNFKVATLNEAFKLYPPEEVITLPEGSWGEGGFHWIWLNEWTEWTWKHIYEAELRMEKLLAEAQARKSDPKFHILLKQIAVELMLLESSDWQFLISTWSARDYAEMRFTEHYRNFSKLINIAEKYLHSQSIDEEDWSLLELCRERDKIFDEIDPYWFGKLEFPV